MPKSSPARSQGRVTPRRLTRGSRSVGSPARSNTSGRLTSLIDQFKEKNQDSFALSPLTGRKSVLSDNTDIEEPRRKSWWKNLNDNSRDVLEVLSQEAPVSDANKMIDDLMDVEVLSQEKKNYTLDIPESSDNESINSIVLPQRKLFTLKGHQPQKKFGQLVGARETLDKLHKTNNHEKTITAGTKELFQGSKRSKPIFPAALLDVTPNKTAPDKTKENIEPEPQVRTIFGNRPNNKRKNIFADFIASESEDEISEIQPKVFDFQKKVEQKRISSISKGKESSPTSSMTTDIETDFMKYLPSSTMMENQIEQMLPGQTPKRARLSKLSEGKESEAATLVDISITNSNKSASKSNDSRITRSQSKTKSQNKSNSKDSIEKDANDVTVVNKTARVNKSKNSTGTVKEGNSSKISKTLNNSGPNKSRTRKTDKTLKENDTENRSQVETVIEDDNQAEDDNNFSLTYEGEENEVVDELDAKLDAILNPMKDNISLKNSSTAKSVAQSEKHEETEKHHKSVSNEEIHGNRGKDKSIQGEELKQDNDNKKQNNECQLDKNEDELRHEVDKSQATEYKDIVADDVNDKQETDTNDNNENEKNQDDNVNEQPDVRNIEESNHEVENDQDNISQEVENEQDDESEEIENQKGNESQEVENDQDNISQEVENEEGNISQEVENEEDNESQQKENVEDNNSQEIENGHINESQVVQEEEVNESQEVQDEVINESQEIENESDASQVVDDDDDNEEQEPNESQELDQDNVDESQDIDVNNESENEVANEDEDNDENENVVDDNHVIDDDNQEGDDENQEVDSEDQEVNDESQEIDDENQAESDESVNADNAVQSEAEMSDNQIDEENQGIDDENQEEDDDNQEMDEENQEVDDENQAETDESDNAVHSDAEMSDNQIDEMEVDDENKENHDSDDVIDESPNVTHDTTGRNRKKANSPEAILQNNAKLMDSLLTKGPKPSIRRTSIKSLNIRPSLAPPRESTGFSTKDSSADNSGWDSHRTTRKTIRQTFGKEYTMRKSLRTLVMEKSARRHTEMGNNTEFPLANSTEGEVFVAEPVEPEESDHEMSRQIRQTTLENYLQKIKQQNLEKKIKMEEAVRNSLKTQTRDPLNLFKVPSKPPPRRLKPTTEKKKTKSVLSLEELPTEVIEDLKYKPPKRFQPTNASWITKRLYKFLESKLEAKYDYKARIRAEKLVETIYHFVKSLRRCEVASNDAVDVLKHELARLDVVRTHFEFYEFFREFMPREVRIKVNPDILNKIPLPRHGVFTDIIRGNSG